MKKSLSILLVSVTLISCSGKEEKKTKDVNTDKVGLKHLHLNLKADENLKDWFDYYKSADTTFSLNDFNFERTDTLSFTKGSVIGLFDKNFDKIYVDFLVFSADKNRYIDFDSYYWTLDDEKKPLFEIDQEINLVDLRTKAVTRIGFRGSSNWVENAFWDNDSTIIFLENNTENCPRITKIELKNSVSTTFKHKGSLSFKTQYYEFRVKKRLTN